MKKLPLNTKLLIGILTVVTIGVSVTIAMPSIKEARQRAAVEEVYGNLTKPAKPAPPPKITVGGETWGNKSKQ